jgi:hypothetical protein
MAQRRKRRNRRCTLKEISRCLHNLPTNIGAVGNCGVLLASEFSGMCEHQLHTPTVLTAFQVALTVNSRVIQTFIEWSPDATDVPLGNGLRIQVLPCVDDLPKARKNQCAAFLASESLLVVWDDDPTKVIERATTIENELMDLVWKANEAPDPEQGSDAEKGPPVIETELDVETGEAVSEKRPTNIMNAVLVAITLVLIMTMLGFGYKQLAFQVLVDKTYLRLAFIIMTPILIFISLVSRRSSARTERLLIIT